MATRIAIATGLHRKERLKCLLAMRKIAASCYLSDSKQKQKQASRELDACFSMMTTMLRPVVSK